MPFRCTKCDQIFETANCPTHKSFFLLPINLIHWLRESKEGDKHHASKIVSGVNTSLTIACKAKAALSLKPVNGKPPYLTSPIISAVTCSRCLDIFHARNPDESIEPQSAYDETQQLDALTKATKSSKINSTNIADLIQQIHDSPNPEVH